MGAFGSRGRVFAPAAALALAGSPAVAHAALPWHLITASNGINTDEAALVRTADGSLHVAWHFQSGTIENLYETPISAAGRVEPGTAITAGWASMENPAIVAGPGGSLRVLFGGIRTTDPNETNDDLNLASSSDGGSTWTLQPGDVAAPGASAYASPIAATAVGSALTPYETWYGTSGVYVHAGLSSSTPNSQFQTFGCCGYYSNLAGDAAGNIMLAWYSNSTGHLGVYAQPVAADGSPAGSPMNMPGTENMSSPQGADRTPLVARPGGGFYVAYATGFPSLDHIRLWRVGSAGTVPIANLPSTAGAPVAAIAAGPDGRLWVFWKRDVNDRPHIFAERSNLAASRFGAAVDAGAPPGAATGFSLGGDATGSGLDVLGSFSIGISSGVSTWYRRVLPGLSLSAKPAKLHHGRSTHVTFLVTDAGDPVKGAEVRASGRSGTTNASGKATFALALKQATTATASRAGYAGARLKLGVVK